MIKRMRTAVMTLLLTVTTATMGDSYQYLTVSNANGDSSYEVGSIKKITFEGEQMVLHLSNGTSTSLPLATLDKMAFTAEAAGISTLEVSQQATVRNGVLHIEAPTGSHITLYNIKGVAVRDVTAAAEQTDISLSGLAKGVYIVRVNDQSKKLLNP